MNEERELFWVEVLADVLNRFCRQNNRHQVSKEHVSKFRALRPPKISIYAYVNRIVLNSNCSEECFVIALIYIERLIRQNKRFFINAFNVHRLILTSVMIAAKYFDDHHFNNSYYCRVGGLSCKEINELEREFLLMINFNLHIDNELFTAWNRCLISYHWRNVIMSQEYEFTSFQWEDEVVSAMASIVASDVLTQIKGFPWVVYGHPAKFEELSISQRSKPDVSSCGCQIEQYRNQSYSRPSDLSRVFKPNVSIQTR